MMAGMPVAPNTVTQRAPEAPICCQVSPVRPVPASEIATPTGNSSAVLVDGEGAAVPTSVSAVARTSDETPPPLLNRSQAVLCTFLI